MDRKLTSSELKKLNSKKALRSILSREPINIERTLRYVDYERKLIKLQTEVIKLQTWAIKNNERVIVLFEGRDAAGKGGAIRRITERINPRHIRIAALQKPTEDEQTQWYFPASKILQSAPELGLSVPFCRVILYCSGVSWAFHSDSVFSTRLSGVGFPFVVKLITSFHVSIKYFFLYLFKALFRGDSLKINHKLTK